MINYFWMGLIVVAVFFAVSMDLTGVRPYEEPLPQVVEDFEGGTTSWKVSTSEWPVPGWFLISADPDSKNAGHSGQLNYRFDDSNRIALSIGTVIASATQKSERLEMMILGDGSGHNLEFEFVDMDGEHFFGPKMKKLGKSKDWMKVSIPLHELIPSPENPAAVVDNPLRLDRIVLVRSQSSRVLEGQIYFDQIQLRYPVVSRVKEELMSDTWMGVVTKSSARWAQLSITLALELIGIMMLWLGLMRIAEQAGLVQLLARGVKPVMRRLFPEIPSDGEAMGAILMNIAANMLGLEGKRRYTDGTQKRWRSCKNSIEIKNMLQMPCVCYWPLIPAEWN